MVTFFKHKVLWCICAFQVNQPKVHNLISGGQRVILRLIWSCYVKFVNLDASFVKPKFIIQVCFILFHSAFILLSLGFFTLCRFPSSEKASRPATSDVTPAKGSLTSAKLNLPQNDTSAQPQTEVDLVLTQYFLRFFWWWNFQQLRILS